jgi:membrane protein DedA with SNARE-associated domain
MARSNGMDFAHYTALVKDFVAQYPNWAAAVVFILAFGESLAFVSLVLPFWAILVAVGAIIGGSNSLNFWIIVTAAASGAALGDWLSYWLGYHYHERIQTMWPLKKYPTLIQKGREFFAKWGAWAIVLARFSGPLRASVPIAAGIAQMPSGMFQLANWSSAFLWAFVLLSPGAVGMKWWFDYFS